MIEGLEIHVEKPSEGTSSSHWGKFTYCKPMTWGPWWLKEEPKKLCENGGVTVFECFAEESIQDEQGVASPFLHSFIIGQKNNGEVVWWHLLRPEFEDGKNVKGSLSFDEKTVIIKGYGGFGSSKGKTICVDIETGKKTEK